MLLNLLTRAAPSHFQATDETDRLMNLWEEYVGPVPQDEFGDFEDFFEQAARLDAAVKEVPLSEIFVTLNGGNRVRCLDTGAPVSQEFSNEPRYGLQSTEALMFPTTDTALIPEQLADSYFRMDAFTKFSQRHVKVCGFNAENSESVDIVDYVHQLHQMGERKVFIKETQAKKGLWILDLPDVFENAETVKDFLITNLDWALIRNEGSTEAFIVQQFIPMFWEYRIFVVNHEAVTSAGCVEEFTPLNNENRFDVQLRHHRKTVSEIVESPKIVDEFLNFVEEVCVAVQLERPEMRNYVVDVALDSKGQPLIVEFNSLLNSGLYASQPSEVVKALHLS